MCWFKFRKTRIHLASLHLSGVHSSSLQFNSKLNCCLCTIALSLDILLWQVLGLFARYDKCCFIASALIKFRGFKLLAYFGCTIPLISPTCPEPMAKSLSFQSFDNSLSMLGASVEGRTGWGVGGGQGKGRERGIQMAGQHDNKAHLKSICCNKGSSSSA